MHRAAIKNMWLMGVNITNITSKIIHKHKTNKTCKNLHNKK